MKLEQNDLIYMLSGRSGHLLKTDSTTPKLRRWLQAPYTSKKVIAHRVRPQSRGLKGKDTCNREDGQKNNVILHLVTTMESKQMLMKIFEMDHFAILLKRHFLHVMIDQKISSNQNKCILQQDLFKIGFRTVIPAMFFQK